MIHKETISLLSKASIIIRIEYEARMTAGNKLHELAPDRFPPPPPSDQPEKIATELDRIVAELNLLYRTGGPLS